MIRISNRARLEAANHGFMAGATVAVVEELEGWLDILSDGHDYEMTEAMAERIKELNGQS